MAPTRPKKPAGAASTSSTNKLKPKARTSTSASASTSTSTATAKKALTTSTTMGAAAATAKKGGIAKTKVAKTQASGKGKGKGKSTEKDVSAGSLAGKSKTTNTTKQSSTSTSTSTSSKPQPKPKPTKKPTKPNRKSRPNSNSDSEAAASDSDPEQDPASDAPASESDSEPDDQDPTSASKPHLTAHTRRVPRDLIDSKWKQMPQSAQKDLLLLLTTVENAVITSFTSERRRLEAQGEIRKVKGRLASLLHKIPIPPVPVREMGFSLERLVEQNKQMESAIRPDIKQITILETEIDRVRALIDARKKILEEVKANSHAQAVARKSGKRVNLHPVFTTSDHPSGKKATSTNGAVGETAAEKPDYVKLYSLVPERTVIDTTYEPSKDREILALKAAMASHLASIQANTAPLEGLKEWIRETWSAVDGVVERMGGEVAERVREVEEVGLGEEEDGLGSWGEGGEEMEVD